MVIERRPSPVPAGVLASMREIEVEYELNYWDGPTMFFAKLDGELVWVEADMTGDSFLKDNRRFTYWKIRGDRTLTASLGGDPDGTFTSEDVGRKV
jgi:hypothetical protein